MTRLVALQGDVVEQRVDAVVNAADRRLPGGGRVDGAIHAAGGPEVLRDRVARFPHGLATGDAGWTTAGRLPARWVVHTVGPDRRAGEVDRAVLERCCRRCLAVCDELSVRTAAAPLVGAGVFGWWPEDAAEAAVAGLSSAPTAVQEVRLVVRTPEALGAVRTALALEVPLRLLQGCASCTAVATRACAPGRGSARPACTGA